MGQATFSEVVSSTSQAGLDVIVAGVPNIASTELLSNSRFSRVLEAAAAYDLVFVDSPPSELLMDARILARQVDGVLYCVRWGKSDMASVANGVSSIQAAGGHLLGLAVTMVRQAEYQLYDARPLQKQPYLLAG